MGYDKAKALGERLKIRRATIIRHLRWKELRKIYWWINERAVMSAASEAESLGYNPVVLDFEVDKSLGMVSGRRQLISGQ